MSSETPATEAPALTASPVGPQAGPVLQNRNFLRLFVAAVASAAGASVAIVSISWLVYTETGSALAVSYVGLAGIVPGIALGLVAGALADRYNRRRVMVLSDLSRAVVMAALAVFLYLAGFNLLVILGVTVIINAFTALFLPASTAILPRIVAAGELEPANGLLQSATQAAQMLGAAAGGAAIAIAGVVPGLAANALTYAISAAFVLQIASSFGGIGRASGPSTPRRSLTHEIGEGVAYLRSHTPILEGTLGFLPGNLFWVMISSFAVVYVATYFPGSPGAYGYLVAGTGGGYALGALVAVRLKLRRQAGLVMALIVTVQGGVGMGLAFSHLYPLSVGLAASMGFGAGAINTVYFATIQVIVPDHVLGRVMSVDMVGAFAGIPAGLVLGGLLATAYGIETDYIIAGVGLLINGLAMVSLKDLRKLRYQG